MLVKVRSKSQITLPSAFVRKLMLNKGEELECHLYGNTVYLTPVKFSQKVSKEPETFLKKKNWSQANPCRIYPSRD